MKLTDREIELIDGMIEVQLAHISRCQDIINRPNGNVTMATKQIGWDSERIDLLRKIKEQCEIEK